MAHDQTTSYNRTRSAGKTPDTGYTWQDLKTDLSILKMQFLHLTMEGEKVRTAGGKMALAAQWSAAACSLELIKWRHQQLKDKRK